MADQKVSDLPSLSGADVDAADLLYIIDSSAGSAGSKKITVGQYQLTPVSGGTANGVAYLNASKVLTTGAGLVFDGSSLGIGTSSPAFKLDVQGASGVGLQIYESSTGNNNRLQITQNGTVSTYNNTYSTGSGVHAWQIGNTERMRLDASGNLGLGVTPSAWGTGFKAAQIDTQSAVTGSGTNTYLSANWYFTTSDRYITNGLATIYRQNAGQHIWYNAPNNVSGAGAAATFTQAMTLDASSNLTLLGSVSLWPATSGGAGSWSIKRAATNSLAFVYDFSGAEAARITSGGDFGINGTPPTDSQFYSKNAGSGRFAGTFENHSAGGYGISIGTASTSLALFYPNAARTGGPVGSITTNGSSTSYVTSSDRRLKENITPAADAGPVIDAIEVIQHDWKVGGHTRFGVIAQDLNAVAPEAVSAGDDGDEIEKTWGVDYSKLVPMLIKEIQSLRARVAALESA